MPSEYKRPLPVPDPYTRPFWDGTRRHQLLLQRCRNCAKFRWTPQYLCPHCLSEAYEWEGTSGKGRLYSYTIIHRPPDPEVFSELPFILAVVKLDEGPYMLTNIMGSAPEDLKVEMPVEVQFEDATDDFTLYKFRPSNGREGRDA